MVSVENLVLLGLSLLIDIAYKDLVKLMIGIVIRDFPIF